MAGREVRRGDGQYEYDACGRLVMKRRTPAGFRMLANYQAKNSRYYCFVAREDVVLPWYKSASANPPCYGWSNIDGDVALFTHLNARELKVELYEFAVAISDGKTTWQCHRYQTSEANRRNRT